jgi:hypothetical protein
VATDIGNNSSMCNSYLKFDDVRQHIAALSWGNCGFAYGAALGAKLEEGELDPGNVRGQGRLDALRHRDPLGSLLPFPGLARRVRLGRLGRRPGIVAHEPPFR